MDQTLKTFVGPGAHRAQGWVDVGDPSYSAEVAPQGILRLSSEVVSSAAPGSMLPKIVLPIPVNLQADKLSRRHQQQTPLAPSTAGWDGSLIFADHSTAFSELPVDSEPRAHLMQGMDVLRMDIPYVERPGCELDVTTTTPLPRYNVSYGSTGVLPYQSGPMVQEAVHLRGCAPHLTCGIGPFNETSSSSGCTSGHLSRNTRLGAVSPGVDAGGAGFRGQSFGGFMEGSGLDASAGEDLVLGAHVEVRCSHIPN